MKVWNRVYCPYFGQNFPWSNTFTCITKPYFLKNIEPIKQSRLLKTSAKKIKYFYNLHKFSNSVDITVKYSFKPKDTKYFSCCSTLQFSKLLQVSLLRWIQKIILKVLSFIKKKLLHGNLILFTNLKLTYFTKHFVWMVTSAISWIPTLNNLYYSIKRNLTSQISCCPEEHYTRRHISDRYYTTCRYPSEYYSTWTLQCSVLQHISIYSIISHILYLLSSPKFC